MSGIYFQSGTPLLTSQDAACNDQGRGLAQHRGRDHEGRRHEVRQKPGKEELSVRASRPPVPGSNLGPAGAYPHCGLRGGRSHCNTVQIIK